MASRLAFSCALVALCALHAGCGGTGSADGDQLPGLPDDNGDCLESDEGCAGSDGDGNGSSGDGDPDNGGDGPSATPLYYIEAGEVTGEASRKPWSSWWYPIWEKTMFEGEGEGQLSPLEKYDAFNRKVLNRPTIAASIERDEFYDPRAETWAGLCDAWAIASIMEPEPNRARQYGEIRFEVGDQKALLLKTYENISKLPLIGDRYDGAWDDEYDDVAPHKLHQVIVSELIGNRQAFLVDEDAGPEVWNAPAWKVISQVERDAENDELVHVRTWLFLASPHVDDPNFVGTIEVTHEYTYDLEGTWEGSRFGVRSGVWTERSRWDHPDYAIVLPDQIKRGSFNRGIDVKTVDLILGRGNL